MAKCKQCRHEFHPTVLSADGLCRRCQSAATKQANLNSASNRGRSIGIAGQILCYSFFQTGAFRNSVATMRATRLADQ